MAKLVGAKVYDAGNQTIATSTDTAVAFDSEVYDDDSFHDTVINNTRLTIPDDGRYALLGNVQFDGNATGVRGIFIRLNATPTIGKNASGDVDASNLQMQVAAEDDFSAGDFLELMVRQSSGGNLDIEHNADFANYFMIHRIG